MTRNKSKYRERMDSLQSYLQQHPDKGYWDWRNSLPDNSDYNVQNVYASGGQPEETYLNWQSNDVPSYADGGEDDLNPFNYRGITYGDMLQTMRQSNPNVYDNLMYNRAVAQSPSSEMVTYVNAQGQPVTRANAQGLEGVLTPEDLPGIGDIAAAEQVRQDVQAGNYVNAGIGAGFLGLGLLSDFLPPLKPMVRRFLRRGSRDVAGQIADGTERVARDVSRVAEIAPSDAQLSEEYMRNAVAQIHDLRDRARAIPEGPVTPELYEQFRQEYKRMRDMLDNDEAYRRLQTSGEDIPDEIYRLRRDFTDSQLDFLDQNRRHRIDYRLRAQQRLREINNQFDNIRRRDITDNPPSFSQRAQNTQTRSLVRNERYDPNNLPDEFVNAVDDLGDKHDAYYFNKSPREAVRKAEQDFSNLRSGQAWNLTHDGAVSTDSYPLQLNMMRKHQNDDMIKVILDESGNPEYMTLNHFGNLKGNAAIDRINARLDAIGRLVGRDDLKAVSRDGGYNIDVPKILFRKYVDGGEEIPSLIPTYKNGGIHIKKANRGKFTAAAKRAGQTVQQHAHSVLNNPHASKLQKKRAQFAVNMKKIANKRKRSK